MADLQHTALTSAQVHEPKHITSNGTGQSGQVITNSSSTAAVSEYRKLKASEIEEFDVYLTGYDADSSAAEDTFFVMPVNGTITNIRSVISDALVTADNVYTITVDGGATTPNTLTVTQSGSAQGDVDEVTITAGGEVSAGSILRLANNGGNSDANVRTWFTVTVRRS